MSAAWANAISAWPRGPFTEALALAVSNDGSLDSGAAWALAQAQRWIGDYECSPLEAYDSVIETVEQLDRMWLAIERAAWLQPIPAHHILPALARFIFERIPVVVRDVVEGAVVSAAPVTRAVVIADRADTLVGMFAAGYEPTGRGDPYALRRAAKHFLLCAMPWVPRRAFSPVCLPEPAHA